MAKEPTSEQSRELLDMYEQLGDPVTLLAVAQAIDSNSDRQFSREEVLAAMRDIVADGAVQGDRLQDMLDRQLDAIRSGPTHQALEARYNSATSPEERATVLREIADSYQPYMALQGVMEAGVEMFSITAIGMQQFHQLSVAQVAEMFPERQTGHPPERTHEALSELSRYDFSNIPSPSVEDLLGGPAPIARPEPSGHKR